LFGLLNKHYRRKKKKREKLLHPIHHHVILPPKKSHGETSLFIALSFLNVYPIKKWGNNLEKPDYKLGQ